MTLREASAGISRSVGRSQAIVFDPGAFGLLDQRRRLSPMRDEAQSLGA
jgi:hypothetical protein